MTLHWWMHWFWVTAQCTVIMGIPFSSATEDPQIERASNIAWKTLALTMSESPETIFTTREPPRASLRMPKAINAYQPSKKRNSVRLVDPPMFRLSTNPSRSIKSEVLQFSNTPFNPSRTSDTTLRRTTNFLNSQRGILSEETIEDDIRTGSQVFQRREDTKIIWISTTNRPLITQDDKKLNFNRENEESLTVLPLRLEEKIKLYVNRNITTGEIESDIISTRTFNGSSVQIDQELSEQRISSATAVPILHADLAESTRLSRARSSFASDYDRNLAQDRSFQENDIDDVVDGDSLIGGASADTASARPTAIYIAAITGSCLAMVIFISTIASLGFVMYRRKYLNPPQTLNSDKCSNPDSSGYIDDSTIRDNSEEMYSLDNDSFLNSLEAMTIQNYWTDSVKHTKL